MTNKVILTLPRTHTDSRHIASSWPTVLQPRGSALSKCLNACEKGTTTTSPEHRTSRSRQRTARTSTASSSSSTTSSVHHPSSSSQVTEPRRGSVYHPSGSPLAPSGAGYQRPTTGRRTTRIPSHPQVLQPWPISPRVALLSGQTKKPSRSHSGPLPGSWKAPGPSRLSRPARGDHISLPSPPRSLSSSPTSSGTLFTPSRSPSPVSDDERDSKGKGKAPARPDKSSYASGHGKSSHAAGPSGVKLH